MKKLNFLKKSFYDKYHVDATLFILIIIILLYGIFITWSACGQNYEIITQKILQTIGGILLMLFSAQISPRVYKKWASYIYSISLISLILVNFFGKFSKGSQRWLDLGFIKFQPSEITKISILIMITYYITQKQYPPSIKNICIALLLIVIPTTFIMLQPDLGTAILIISSGLCVLFLSGINLKLIIFILFIIFILMLFFWYFFMHEYQRMRIFMLFHPEVDPLGTGYHTIQSKIAIGSGGFTGKGWLNGTQSQLEFLPECHTDFIFSVIGEELGFLGILVLLLLYVGIIVRGFFIAIYTPNMFGRLIIGSFMLIFFIHIFINISMTTGLLPVVGIPLPFISYGGSSLCFLMIGFGIVMSIHRHRTMMSKII